MFEQLAATLTQPYFSWIAKLLSAYPNAEVFLVGGAVRDAALSRSTKDYDFVVRGVQARHLQEFLGTVGIVNLVGRSFGVYKFIPDDGYEEFKTAVMEPFDIALPRTEASWGTGGYRDVEVQSNHDLPVEEDLARRDFTINAMALRLNSQFPIPNSQSNSNDQMPNPKPEVIDPFHGMQDIEQKIIRAVGEPIERFKEDYTRMLRGLRLACQLGFSIDAVTLDALKTVMPSINDKRPHDGGPPALSPLAEFVAPREVVSRELLKAFYADPVRAFDLYDQSGAFEVLMPELLKMKSCPQPEEFHAEGDVWIHTRLALQALQSEEYAKTFSVSSPHPNPLPKGEGEVQKSLLPAGEGGRRPGEGDPHYNTLLVMAILLHDVGKPPMLRTPEEHGVDRIRFDEHDTVGAEIVNELARRLVLSIMVEGPLHVDYDKLTWLIKHHLILLHTKAEDFKASTVEKYFFNAKNPGETLLRLAFCDGSAAIPKAGGKPSLQNLYDMMARIKRMDAAIRDKRIPYKPLVNGDEIMALLKIPSGPGIGEILRGLREEQLSARVTSKDEAVAWLKKSFE